MDALANGWAGSMELILLWAWMHWPEDGLVAWTWSCAGMDALANGWAGSRGINTVWAWMHRPIDGLLA